MPSHTLPRSVPSLLRFGPPLKIPGYASSHDKMWGYKVKKINKLYNYVNCIIMILTTVIRNIYIIFIPWVKQSFSESWRLFKYTRIYQRYAWNRTIASIKIKKLPTVGGGNPPPPLPPRSLRSFGLGPFAPSLAPPPPLTRNARYATSINHHIIR